jgi:transglutaminase-like putative cysteine protease
VNERRSAVATVDERVPRRFALDQTIRYRYSAPVTNLRQRLRVVPPSTHGPQRRRRWQLAVQGVPSWSTRTFLDRFGNETIDVIVPRVDDAVEFVVDVEADTDESRGPYAPVVDRGYLRPTRLTRAEGSVAELVPAGGDADVASLCERVHRCLDYEWGITGVATTASEALAGGRGVCQDYAHIMLAACRAAGVPARYVSGHLAGEGGSHAWVEVLHPHPYCGDRWVAQGWDPTHNRRANSDYLVVAVGRDYTDVAPLSGTYDGRGATNTLAVKKRLELT